MDFDDAYANAAHIEGANAYPDMWTAKAGAFRARTSCDLDVPYGDSSRQKLDFFYPQGTPKGLVVFVHGGYWLRFDKSYWSHLAGGATAKGWAVAMPSYDLCPAVRITQIGQQAANAIAFAAKRVGGPVRLVGHSAGGHLAARVPALPDPTGWRGRLEQILSISPVADLAPLMKTSMNVDLAIDAAEAQRESPVNQPAPHVPVTVWVGSDERPVFLAQAHALAQAWSCKEVVETGFHHFDVIAALAQSDSPITRELLA